MNRFWQNERMSDTRRASAPPLLYDNRRSIGNPGLVDFPYNNTLLIMISCINLF